MNRIVSRSLSIKNLGRLRSIGKQVSLVCRPCSSKNEDYVPPPAEDLPDKSYKSYVSTDVDRIIDYCCINYMKDGSDIKLGEDSDYPDWLWELSLGRPKRAEELDPDKDGWLFWRRYRREYYRYQKPMSQRAQSRSWWLQYDKSGGSDVIYRQGRQPTPADVIRRVKQFYD